MEALIVIPVALIIYGWMQTIPATEPPEGANGYDFPVICCQVDEDFVFPVTCYQEDEDFDFGSSESFCVDAGVNTFGFDSNDDWNSSPFMEDDLMFDPINSWCSFNIYHDNDIHTCNCFDDSFNSVFDDNFATFHSFDN